MDCFCRFVNYLKPAASLCWGHCITVGPWAGMAEPALSLCLPSAQALAQNTCPALPASPPPKAPRSLGGGSTGLGSLQSHLWITWKETDQAMRGSSPQKSKLHRSVALGGHFCLRMSTRRPRRQPGACRPALLICGLRLSPASSALSHISVCAH